MGLKTLTPDHRDLRQISFYIPVDDPASDGERAEEIHRQWVDLDRLLVRLWELNRFHTRVIHSARGKEGGVRERLERLLPEMTKRGIVELKS